VTRGGKAAAKGRREAMALEGVRSKETKTEAAAAEKRAAGEKVGPSEKEKRCRRKAKAHRSAADTQSAKACGD